MQLKWMNAEQTILFVDGLPVVTEDDVPSLVLEPDSERWDEFANLPNIEFFPVKTSAALLVEAKEDAKKTVDETVGQIRLAYITEIPGQQMVYLDKEIEASAFASDTDDPKDMTKYPYIAREAAVLSQTPETVAATYASLSAQWRPVSVALEGIRISSKTAIDAATDDAAIEAAIMAFETALAALAA